MSLKKSMKRTESILELANKYSHGKIFGKMETQAPN